MTTASDALRWMNARATSYPALFRGQTRVYPTVQPSIARVAPDDRADLWAVQRLFVSSAHAVTGYRVPTEHDALALLQHYVGCSPVVDLTGTPAVALYFALLDAPPGSTSVVYTVDRQSLPLYVTVSDPSFLLLPLRDGGLRHRWIRQDGYTVGPADWRDRRNAHDFDLLELPVESLTFTVRPGDRALLADHGLDADLEDTADDPLAVSVRSTYESIARERGRLSAGVRALIARSKTRDWRDDVLDEIESLQARASENEADPKLIRTLNDLERSAHRNHWETSHDAALAFMRDAFDARTAPDPTPGAPPRPNPDDGSPPETPA